MKATALLFLIVSSIWHLEVCSAILHYSLLMHNYAIPTWTSQCELQMPTTAAKGSVLSLAFSLCILVLHFDCATLPFHTPDIFFIHQELSFQLDFIFPLDAASKQRLHIALDPQWNSIDGGHTVMQGRRLPQEYQWADYHRSCSLLSSTGGLTTLSAQSARGENRPSSI